MLDQFAFLDLGTPELIIILAIILLLFGGKNLPKLSKALGESMREIRKGLSDDIRENEPDAKKKTPKTKRPSTRA
jgi:sec-independent protein translocase protein TatA